LDQAKFSGPSHFALHSNLRKERNEDRTSGAAEKVDVVQRRGNGVRVVLV
jgi:hypothetical protein